MTAKHGMMKRMSVVGPDSPTRIDKWRSVTVTCSPMGMNTAAKPRLVAKTVAYEDGCYQAWGSPVGLKEAVAALVESRSKAEGVNVVEKDANGLSAKCKDCTRRTSVAKGRLAR